MGTPPSSVIKSDSGAATPAPDSGSKSPEKKGSKRLSAVRTDPNQYACIFRMSGQYYALDVSHVGEVVAIHQWISVPLAPPAVIGMCNLRGTALAVADLAMALDLPVQSKPPEGSMTILVLRSPKLHAGVRIDSAETVYPFRNAKFQPRAGQWEHPAVKGLLELNLRGKLLATLLDGDVVTERLLALEFKGRDAAAAQV